MLGGVGNVVRNLRAQAASVCLVTLLGRDEAAREIKGLLRDDVDIESHLLEEDDRPTTIKPSSIAGGQPMLSDHSDRVKPEAAAPPVGPGHRTGAEPEPGRVGGRP